MGGPPVTLPFGGRDGTMGTSGLVEGCRPAGPPGGGGPSCAGRLTRLGRLSFSACARGGLPTRQWTIRLGPKAPRKASTGKSVSPRKWERWWWWDPFPTHRDGWWGKSSHPPADRIFRTLIQTVVNCWLQMKSVTSLLTLFSQLVTFLNMFLRTQRKPTADS